MCTVRGNRCSTGCLPPSDKLSRFAVRHSTPQRPSPGAGQLARASFAALLLLMLVPAAPFAHEVPRGVTVHGYVRQEGHVLRMLVRAPLEAMRDVEFPQTREGYLVFSRSDSALRDAAQLWIANEVDVFADGIRVEGNRITAARASLPSDGSFASWQGARAHMASLPVADSILIPWMQAMLDVEIEYQLPDDSAYITISPHWAKLGVNTSTVLHVVDTDGEERLLSFNGNPGRIGIHPGLLDTSWRFVLSGFRHILDGVDHLLFLLCLVIPIRSFWKLAGIVTSFTIAHSITLVASASGFAPDASWFPPLIETLIALSIVYMAFENIVGARIDQRWKFAFGFGLVHGFGFSFVLREELQFAGSNLVAALAAFNVGVELGQLLVLAAAVPVLAVLFRRAIPERAGSILLSAIVAHQAWHWMTDRFAEFRTYELVLEPGRDLAIGVIRFLMLIVVAGGTMWLMSLIAGRVRAMREARVVLLVLVVGGLLSAVTQSLEAQETSRSTASGVYTARQAEQGREVFNGNCTGCHTAASHTGAGFARWMGRPLSELFDYIASYMPKSAPGSLTEDEYVWVTAYLLKLNGMPAGAKPITADMKELEAVRIDSAAVPRNLPALSQMRPSLQHWLR